jgi:glycosyl transferase family 11
VGRPNLIISTLAGALGNQMFQYAAGRALALRRNTELQLDLGWLTPVSRFVYELGVFGLDVRLISAYRHTRRERVRELVGLAPAAWRQNWRRDGFSFDPKVIDLPQDTRLVGYWQSEKYFEDFGDVIRADFRFSEPLDASNACVAEAIAASTAVAVHVRRGDYVTDPGARSFLGTLPLDYYLAGAELMRDRTPDPRFFVFSDDPAWCRSHLRLGGPTTVVDHNQGRGHDDLRLMALCRHHIIANSSFSWWGAWLASPEGQIVVAPERWGAAGNAGDVIPDRWCRL